jgi:hypothetical protein
MPGMENTNPPGRAFPGPHATKGRKRDGCLLYVSDGTDSSREFFTVRSKTGGNNDCESRSDFVAVPGRGMQAVATAALPSQPFARPVAGALSAPPHPFEKHLVRPMEQFRR